MKGVVDMRSLWLGFLIISLLIVACNPSVNVEKTYLEPDRKNTGAVDVYSAFDKVEKAYKKIADLEVIDKRNPKFRDREEMLEDLKAKAAKMCADGIVITEEGKSFQMIPAAEPGMSESKQEFLFIKCTAIIYS